MRINRVLSGFMVSIIAAVTALAGVVAMASPAAAAPEFTVDAAGATNCSIASLANCRTTIILTGTDLPVVAGALIGLSVSGAQSLVTVKDATSGWTAGRETTFSSCEVLVGASTATTMVLSVGGRGNFCNRTNSITGGDQLTIKLHNPDGSVSASVDTKATVPTLTIPSTDEVTPPYGPLPGGTSIEPVTGRVVVRTSKLSSAPKAAWFGTIATTDITAGAGPGLFSVVPPPAQKTPKAPNGLAEGVAVQVVDTAFGVTPEACFSILPNGCADEYFYIDPATSATNITDPLDLNFTTSISAGTAVGSTACGKNIPAGLSASLTVGAGVKGGPVNVASSYGFSYNILGAPQAFVASATITVATPIEASISLTGQLSGCQAIPIPGLGIPNVAGFYVVVGGQITAKATLTVTINKGTYTLTGGWIPGSNPGDLSGATMVSKCVDATDQPATTCVSTALQASLEGTVVVSPLWLQLGPPAGNVGAGLSAAATGKIDFPTTAATGYDICVAGRWAAHLPVVGDFDGNWLGPINVLGDGARCPFGAIAAPPKKDQTITFTGADTGIVGGTYTPTATATSALPVVFTVAPTSSSGACALAAGLVSFTGPGTCVISADQAGNADWNAAPVVTASTIVSAAPPTPSPKKNQSITFTPPTSGAVGGTFTPTATATSGLAVTFSLAPNTTTGACALSGGVVSFIGAGNCVISADQAGNADWNAAPQVRGSTPVTTVLVNTAARYAPLTNPVRILDTRGGSTVDGLFADLGTRPAGSVLELKVAGRADVPTNASAAVLNVIAADPKAAGFVTVYACGQPTPTSSNLNYVRGQVVSNSVVSRIGAQGSICIFTQAETHLIADLQGYFPPTSIEVLPVPTRVIDTRPPLTIDPRNPAAGLVAGGSVLEVTIAGRAGIPADATTVTMNVTVTGGSQAGFLTVFPCGQTVPTTSNLTYSAGQTVANATISRLGTNGKVCLSVTGATYVLVDVAASLPSSIYTPLNAPRRLLDTRTSATGPDQFSPIGAVTAGSTTELQISGLPDVTSAGATELTITAIDPAADGYLTVFPCGQPVPIASNLNVRRGVTVTTDALAKVGIGGKVCVFAKSATHLAIDMAGYFI